ncbi:hypothetical protein EOA32_00745 [Mesorhizobium sp. M1A.F.Ca.ET.072.01.1.1]|uniref:hypothetical protein n=1 Tax=Mesorhizobium sp. M1A.F.Ca.ET.072.01.1.1 TaxID=2496753 RepID=UPI000FD1CE5C|nr:hypothetical protein [Mesorhizobium sp. M1A.F.Ca.ET.072.01.1.1]RUW55579.1 hypothetical protein EOA32_00745 [Mesorhizobium sp. M1A.F.Ca.ET.072.01.1.1]
MENGILWAATDVTIRSRVYPGHSRRVAVEPRGIIYRNGWDDPTLFRDRTEADSFIETLSRYA